MLKILDIFSRLVIQTLSKLHGELFAKKFDSAPDKLHSSFVTKLPLGVSSSSPSLEARRLLPVHLSVGQAINCSGKVM